MNIAIAGGSGFLGRALPRGLAMGVVSILTGAGRMARPP
jgi:nucleoside-diphosphate-sugar epimerase